MPKFRTTSIVVEAVKWDGEAHTANLFIGEAYGKDWEFDNASANILIPILEGKMVGNVGDWIIKGINGQFYSLKPDIFEKIYEPEK